MIFFSHSSQIRILQLTFALVCSCSEGLLTTENIIYLFTNILYWPIPENIHTIPRTAFTISEGEGGSRLWNSEGMGGIYDWKSEGMGEFHRWDFWSRKCRVSSLKTLLLWTFVVRK